MGVVREGRRDGAPLSAITTNARPRRHVDDAMCRAHAAVRTQRCVARDDSWHTRGTNIMCTDHSPEATAKEGLSCMVPHSRDSMSSTTCTSSSQCAS